MHFLVLDDVASLRKRLAAHQTLVGLLAGVLAHVVEQVPCLVADLAATVVSADQNRVSPHCFFVVDALAFILVALETKDLLLGLLAVVWEFIFELVYLFHVFTKFFAFLLNDDFLRFFIFYFWLSIQIC